MNITRDVDFYFDRLTKVFIVFSLLLSLTEKALNGIQWEVAQPLTLNYWAPIASMDATMCVSNTYVWSVFNTDTHSCIHRSNRGSIIQCQRVGNFRLDSIEGLSGQLSEVLATCWTTQRVHEFLLTQSMIIITQRKKKLSWNIETRLSAPRVAMILSIYISYESINYCTSVVLRPLDVGASFFVWRNDRHFGLNILLYVIYVLNGEMLQTFLSPKAINC